MTDPKRANLNTWLAAPLCLLLYVAAVAGLLWLCSWLVKGAIGEVGL